jgi:hypothetical protein
MNVVIPESLLESLKLIIKYQNTLLLKEISNEKGWKYSELKKEFLKDEEVNVLLKKYNKKQNKKKKAEAEPLAEPLAETEAALVEPLAEPLPKPLAEVIEPLAEVIEPLAKPLAEPLAEAIEPLTEAALVEAIEPLAEAETTPKKSRKKKIKKIINSLEIKCHKYIFDEEVFYINVDNLNAYDKNLEFVGVMIGNGINFNADEKEN